MRLANPEFLGLLAERSELLVVHLQAEDYITDLRLLQRGADQPQQLVQASRSRAERLAAQLNDSGIYVLSVDAGCKIRWRAALAIGRNHLTSEETQP